MKWNGEYKGYKYTAEEHMDGRRVSHWIQFEGDHLPPDEDLEEIVMRCGCWMADIIKHPDKVAVGCSGWID